MSAFDKSESTSKDDPLNEYLNEDRVSRDDSVYKDKVPQKPETDTEQIQEYSLINSSARKNKSLREKLLTNNPALEVASKKEISFGLANKFRSATNKMSNNFDLTVNNDMRYENPYADPIRCTSPPTVSDSIKGYYFGDLPSTISTVSNVSGLTAIGTSLASKIAYGASVDAALVGLGAELAALATPVGAIAAAGAVVLELAKDAVFIAADYDQKKDDFKNRCEPLKAKLNSLP